MVATRRSNRIKAATATTTAPAAPQATTAPPAKKQPKKRAATAAKTKTAPNKKTKTVSKKAAPSTSAAAAASTSAPPAATPAPAPVKVPAVAAATKTSTVSPPVDTDISGSNQYTVVKDEVHDQWYDVVLNQCNITGNSNNNKYYRIQLLEKNGYFYVWFKWGRVGEARNQNDLKGSFGSVDDALKVFEKKYKDKTGNKWGPFADFAPKAKKYTRIQIDNEVQVTDDFKNSNATGGVKAEDIEYLPSKLDPKTKELIEVLFSEDMRNEALTAFDLDLAKLPLGVPSQQQIQAGASILNEIEDKLNGGAVSASYPELSSRFYTAIPHSFGRRRPPAINSQTSLQWRYDMCNILLDMYSQNETLRQIEGKQRKKQVPYPADTHYDTLNADMKFVDKNSVEWKTIQKYFQMTSSNGKLLDAWEVDRKGEKERFAKFDGLDNRRLLWHGTNIAVVAPIITSGLRIMPHSGGRVGKGIYLASMQEKSAGYTTGYGSKYACMFLCEGALGKSHVIEQDDWRITKPPAGHDSVLASGKISPKVWTNITIDGKDVSVPQSKAENQSPNSNFYHDEFLVYDESQVRLRYVLTVKPY